MQIQSVQSVYCSQVVPLGLAHADITAVTATVATIIFSLSMRRKMIVLIVFKLFSLYYQVSAHLYPH